MPRTVYATGGIAAATAAGSGLAVIVTLTVIGWVAAPHDAFGEEIVDLLQGAVLAWLVGHHVSFSVPDGQIALLPIGLVLLPGLLLYRSGRWLARSCEIVRIRYVYRAALAIAGPYAAIAGTLALVARTDVIEPSMLRALVMGFVIAFLAGGLGVLCQLMRDKGVAARDLLGLMPARSRSLLVGMLTSTGTLLLGGMLLFLAGLAVNLPEAVETTRVLEPGLVGGALLLVIQLAYLPNAVVFAVCYALGPGFAMGAGTVVAPTGVSTGALPMLPMLAALPENGAAPVVSLVALAVPFVAGAVGGVLTQRSAPDVVSEAAPLWGFVCGVTTGMLCAALAESAGGSLGGERLGEVGPSAWQVGLVAALEVGVAAAAAAWIANWWYARKSGPAGKAGTTVKAAKAEAAGSVGVTAKAGAATKAGTPAKARSTGTAGKAGSAGSAAKTGTSGSARATAKARSEGAAGKERRSAAEMLPEVPVGEGLATVTPLRPREESRSETVSLGKERSGSEAVPRNGTEPGSEGRVEPTPEEKQDAREKAGADRAAERTARRAARQESRVRRREQKRDRRSTGGRWWRGKPDEDEELYGITYEADPGGLEAPKP